jgi:hypothetical protein
MHEFDDAIAEVERRAGGQLPDDYRQWLLQHRKSPSDHQQTPYDLDELRETQRLVQDAIPPGHLAIGADGYGNQVLLRFSDGSIEWWCHEDQPEYGTDTIRPSFEEFMRLVAQGEV